MPKTNFHARFWEKRMLVQSPGSVIKSHLVCKNLEIDIKGVRFPTTVIVIESAKLDVILGMNWLTQYQVCINCATREVTLANQEGQTIKFIARKGIPKREMIFTAVAEELDLIPVVSEFPMYSPKNYPECL